MVILKTKYSNNYLKALIHTIKKNPPSERPSYQVGTNGGKRGEGFSDFPQFPVVSETF